MSQEKSLPQKRYDLQILQSLRKIIQAIDLHSKKLTAQHHITTPQLVCLLSIIENKSISVASLAKSIHLSPSTVVGVLDRLENKKLITRKRDKVDRRVVKLYPTASGKKFAKNAPSPLQDKLSNSLLELSLLEQSTILLSLQRLVDLMDATDINTESVLETGKIVPVKPK